MRTLNKNKTKLWLVNPTSTSEKKDGDGNYTGEVIKTYSTPVVIYIALYPYSGKIMNDTFGKDATLDLVSVSNDVVLTKDSLLFLTQPSANYDLTYTYRIEKILPSINTYLYGLKRRT